ncbi:MAG: cytidylate kinase-like family protein [Lachnospiraceae bacterium]|nr:cytidylate kinase-like family protein [Lachnospiraceae bacterium]
MYGNKVITIGREYGSGGHDIGRMLAERLGVKCYDKELITLAAKKSGLCEEVMETHDESPVSSFFYSLVMDVRSIGPSMAGFMDTPLHQKVFLAQFETIQHLAKEESCVIVGRCADYALHDYPNVTSVFVTADVTDKVDYCCRLNNMTKDKALDFIAKQDKKRADYYNYFSNKQWGAAATYDLCINSSRTGYEGAVELILDFIDHQDRILKNS